MQNVSVCPCGAQSANIFDYSIILCYYFNVTTLMHFSYFAKHLSYF